MQTPAGNVEIGDRITIRLGRLRAMPEDEGAIFTVLATQWPYSIQVTWDGRVDDGLSYFINPSEVTTIVERGNGV